MSDIKEATQVFNPRLREGGDRPDRQTVFRGVFSIHASAKEATSGAMTPIYYWRFSIHASAKEATINMSAVNNTVCFSIHASAKEATFRKK